MVINNITRNDVNAFRILTQERATNALDIYQDIAGKSAIYPGQDTPMGLVYCALKLNGEAGELAEHVGKAMRDDGFIDLTDKLTAERREAIIKEGGDALWYLARIAGELGMTLSELALANLEKLCDRTERNVLQGSGDER